MADEPKTIEQQIGDRVAERTADKRSSIQSYHNYIAEKLREIEKLPEEIATVFAVKNALEVAGFQVRMSSYVDQLYIDIKPHELVELARVAGPMSVVSKTPVMPDEKGGRVKFIDVTLEGQRHKFVNVTYRAKKTKEMKCKVVTVVSRRKELQCSV